MIGDLARDVQYLKDRLAILDVVNRHARGCDRHDADLVSATYWPDGHDEHGAAVNSGDAYGEWANRTHARTSSAHLHHVTTHTCEIDGDVAHAESYVMVVLLGPDERSVQVMTGRYLDRLERREDVWRIAVRRSTVEAAFSADAAMLHNPFFLDQGFLKGTRDRTDLSYARPLTMDTTTQARWK